MTGRTTGGEEMERERHHRGSARFAALPLVAVVAAGLALWIGCSDKGNVSPFNPSDVPISFIGSMTAVPARLNAGDQQSTVTVYVIDENGAPVSGVNVRFDTDLGQIDSSAVTGSDGFARATFTAGSTEGSAHVFAFIGSFQKEVLIQIGQGELVAGTSSIIADGSSTTTLTAQVIDDTGFPQSGIAVFFESTAGFVTQTVFTEDDGTAEATLRSIASRTDVEALVTARIADATLPEGFRDYGDALVTFRGISIETSVERTTLVADGEDSTFVHSIVKETTSQVTVPKVVVSYGTTLGTISNTDSTDATGVSTASLFAGTFAGTAHINATVFGVISDTVSVEFTPLTLRVVGADPGTIPADGSTRSDITALLLNSSNNPVEGKEIVFSTTLGVVVGRVTTGADGRAVSSLTSADEPGTAWVYAAFGTLRDSVSVSMSSLGEQTPSSILIRTSSPKIQVAQTGGTETATITAELFNEHGDKIQSGFDVTFRITEGPGGGEHLGGPQNGEGPVTVAIEDGTARIALSSGTISGTIAVEAQVPPLLSANARVVIGAGPPDSIGVAVTTSAFPLSGALFSYIVTATVVDKYSNSVEDSTAVFFAVQGGACDSGEPLPDLAIDGLAFTHNLADCPGVQNIAHGVAVTCIKAPFPSLDEFPNFWLSAETAGGTIRTCKNYTSGAEPGPAASIALQSVESSSIGVAGTGQNSSSELVFEVRDAQGHAVNQDNAVDIQFEFTATPGGGAYLSPLTVTSDASGLVRTSLNSGTIAGVAKVRARVIGSSPVIQSDVASVAIHGGPPDLAHFSLAKEKANIAGRLYLGLEDKITAFLFDKYSNPVPQGTVVWYSTNRGGVVGSATTNAVGQAQVSLYSASPLPTCADTGYAHVTAHTIDENNATITAGARVLFSGPTVVDVVSPATPSFTVPAGGSQLVTFFIGDDCGNPIVATSSVNIILQGAGADMVGGGFTTVADTQSRGATFYTVSVFDSDPTDTLPPQAIWVQIEVTSPNGNVTLIYGGTVD